MKGKWIKYALRAIIAVIAAWILFLGVAFFYIETNKEKLIGAIKEDIGKKISGKIEFSELTVDFLQNFPNISIDLGNLSLRDSLFSLHDLLFAIEVKFYSGDGIVCCAFHLHHFAKTKFLMLNFLSGL